MSTDNMFVQRIDLSRLSAAVSCIKDNISKVIVGQHKMIELIIAGLLSDGHILIEGVPGVAKTLSAKLLAKSVDVNFSRIQFTPDLMPSDVLGTSIFNPKEASFQFKKGPIFSNIVLIDEINRAPAKTQAALFEVMEERQISIDGITYLMEPPFIVLATQNPIEHEGTYRLPEAQLDRFLFKIDIGYPSMEEEVQILSMQQSDTAAELLKNVEAILGKDQLKEFRKAIKALIIEPKLVEYIAKIVNATRNNSALYLGASPRASLAILKSSKSMAAIKGRDFVIPEDIIEVTPHVLRHRIILTPEKEMEGVTADMLIQKIISEIEIPR